MWQRWRQVSTCAGRWNIGSIGYLWGRICYKLNSLLERPKTLVAILSFKCLFYDWIEVKWQMTSERRWCKNRAADCGADLLGWVSQKKRRGTFSYSNTLPVLFFFLTASRWLSRNQKRSHEGGEDETERRILWPWQRDAVETLPVQIVAWPRCCCFVFLSSNHRLWPPAN